MALNSTVTTAAGAADPLNKAWRNIQGKVAQGFQFESEEFAMLDELPEEETPYSLRESTLPVDLNEEAGVASIPEGGYEAKASSVGLEEIQFFLQHFNARFSASNLSHYADKGMEVQVERQLSLQAAKKVQALAAHFSDYHYGSSSGVLALTDTDITATASQSIVLKSGYGLAGITSLPFIAAKFRRNDRIAVLNAGALVAMGTVTAVTPATGTLAVTWDSIPAAVATNGLQVVKANSMEATTLAGTDYNRGLVGWVDILTAPALHGLTHDNWSVAYSDTAAGRFTGLKLRRMANEIANAGGGTLNRVIWSQGVERDVIALERSAVRFGDAFGIELDGSVKSKGRQFFSSRRAIPGYVKGYDKTAVRKKALLPKPDGKQVWGDGKELQDQSGRVFRVELVVGQIVRNRKNIAYCSNQSEQ